jgi:hypothetical protein
MGLEKLLGDLKFNSAEGFQGVQEVCKVLQLGQLG